MVIDSHTLLWWLEGDVRLSPRVKQILENESAEPGSLIVSAVTFWGQVRYFTNAKVRGLAA